MFFSKFFSKPNSIVGVDIGTANIKVVQLTHGDKQVSLDTYGMVNMAYQMGGKDDEPIVAQMAEVLMKLLVKSGVTAKRCVISFPNSSVFSSVITLPKMDPKELAGAVEYEAKKYVPLSLSEIDLSWTTIAEPQEGESSQQILLTAVPKQVILNYQKVFSLAGLDPEVGEIEALALIRCLVGEGENCAIIDIGAKSTGLNIVEKGLLRLSRNLNVGGDTITTKISETLNVSKRRAEQFKKDFGINGPSTIPEVVKPVLNIVKNEVRQLLTIYQSQGVKLGKIILAGGGANLPGILEFFSDLNLPVEKANPFKNISYPKSLEEVVKRSALSLPVALGLALRKD